MVDPVSKLLRSLGPQRRPLLIGLVLAVLAVAAVLVAVFTDALPLGAVAIAGGAGMAALIVRDLRDGDGVHSRRNPARPKVAQVKRRDKRPEPHP